MTKKFIRSVFVGSLVLFLSGCSSFSGIRTPKYDGQPFVPQPEKIAAFEEGREVIGAEKEYYLPEPFSEMILEASLDFIDHEPMLLAEGTYTVGEDIPASRVTVMGDKEDPTLAIGGNYDPAAPPEVEDYKVGTMTIRDPEGKLYFENMFHPFYGVQIIQVDLIPGHTIEITGKMPEFIFYFEEFLPSEPYLFDTRWAEYLDELEQEEGFVAVEMPELASDSNEEAYFEQQAIKVLEPGQEYVLKAGIYEVGVHLEAGTYEVTEQASPTYTGLYLFREGEEPRVFDISKNLYGVFHRAGVMNMEHPDSIKPMLALQTGDKIYPHYVDYLILNKVD